MGGIRLTSEPFGEVFIAGQPCISPHRLSRIFWRHCSVRSRENWRTPALLLLLVGSRVTWEVLVLPLVRTLNLWLWNGCFTVFMSFLHNYLM